MIIENYKNISSGDYYQIGKIEVSIIQTVFEKIMGAKVAISGNVCLPTRYLPLSKLSSTPKITLDEEMGIKKLSTELAEFIQLIANLVFNKIKQGIPIDLVLKDVIDPLISLPNRVENEKKLFELACAKKWRDPFFEEAEYPWYAIAGVMDGQFSIPDAGMVLFHWSLRKTFSSDQIEVYSLYDSKGCLDDKAVQIVSSTLEYPESGPRILQGKSFLKPLQKKLYYLTMGEENALQQQFFVVKDAESEWDVFNDQAKMTITQTLYSNLGFNLLDRFDTSRIIASPSMMELLVDAKYSHKTPLHFMLGVAPREFFIEGLKKGFGVLSLPSPYEPLPDTADGSKVTLEAEFWKHDVYHLVRKGAVLPETLKAYSQFAEKLLILLKNNSFGKGENFLKKLFLNMIDVDFTAHQQEHIEVRAKHFNGKIDESVLFWDIIISKANLRIENSIVRAFADVIRNQDLSSFSSEKYYEGMLAIAKKINHSFYVTGLWHQLALLFESLIHENAIFNQSFDGFHKALEIERKVMLENAHQVRDFHAEKEWREECSFGRNLSLYLDFHEEP